MLITQKKQYALRAIFELARNQDEVHLKTAQIAEAQAIPVRFLEIILNHLKHAGLVSAKRGAHGGYRLKQHAHEITVGQIFNAMESGKKASACVSCIAHNDCPLYGDGDCAFMPLWMEVQDAIDLIYNRTTVQNLLDKGTIAKANKS